MVALTDVTPDGCRIICIVRPDDTVYSADKACDRDPEAVQADSNIRPQIRCHEGDKYEEEADEVRDRDQRVRWIHL